MRSLLNLLKRIKSKQLKLKFIRLLFVTILLKLVGAISPLIAKKLIDTAVYTRNMQSFKNFGILYVGITILFIMLLSVRYFYEKLFYVDVLNSLRKNVLNKIYSSRAMHVLEKDSGYFIQRINSDVKSIASFFSTDVNVFVTNVIISVIIFYLMVELSFRLTLVVVILFIFFYIVSKKILPIIKRLSRKLMETEEELNTITNDSVVGLLHIKSFNLQNYMRGKVIEVLGKYTETLKKYTLYGVIFDILIVSGTLNLVDTVIEVGGGVLILRSVISVGTLMAFMSYFYKIWDSVEVVLDFPRTLREKGVSAERVLELFNLPEEDNSLTSEIDIDEIDTIVLEDIELSLGNRKIFDGLNLRIKKKDHICILGDNGTGKTTLCRLLVRIIEPDRGTVYINGIDYKKLSPVVLRSKIMHIPQEPFIFRGSIEENIYFDVSPHKKDSFPSYFMETQKKNAGEVVDNKNTNLSGGEKKLIQLARGLYRDGEVYIIDEPFAFVDAKYTEILKDFIEKQFKNKTLIVITHDKTILSSLCEKVYVLEKGRIRKYQHYKH